MTSAQPQRIVSLVPSMTETVCRLGAGGRLVGCTRYCEEPAAELQAVARVGGTKNPQRERIAELAPDLVILNGEENREEDIEWLRAGFPVLLHTPRTVPEAAAAVRELGAALGAEAKAEPIVAVIEAELRRAAALAPLPIVRVFYAIWKKPWMSVSADTYIHDVLARAGGANVCGASSERYPECPPERVRELGVDLVLLPSEPWVFSAAERAEAIIASWFGSGVPVVLCDGRDFCWHGARTASGLRRAVDVLRAFRTPVG